MKFTAAPWSLAEAVAIFAAFGWLLWTLAPLLVDREPAGWDTSGHLYLVQLMIGYLREWRLSGFDPNWYGGYPAFSAYPPLPYVVPALLSILSGGAISPTLAFNISTVLSALVLLWAMGWSAHAYFGRASVAPTLLATLLFFSAGREVAHVGIGLGAQLQVGLYANFFALPLWVLLLGAMERARGEVFWRGAVCGGLLLAALILSHLLLTIWAFGVLGIFALMHGRKGASVVAGALIGGLTITGWWWVPLYRSLWLTAGGGAGVWLAASDPLMVLLSDFAFLPDRLSRYHSAVPNSAQFHVRFWDLIPAQSLLVLVLGGLGLITLFRHGRPFLPTLFLLTLILVPREFLPKLIDAPIHYYRFLQCLFLIAILLTGRGAVMCFESLARISPPAFRTGSQVGACGVMITLLAIRTFPAFDLTKPLPLGAGVDYTYHLFADQFPEYAHAQEILNYLRQHPTDGRLAVETTSFDAARLGSPHYFTSHIPPQTGIPVVPGLLAESAFSSLFINPTLAARSFHLRWGKQTLYRNRDFQKQSWQAIVKRLEIFGVDRILTASGRMYHGLRYELPPEFATEELRLSHYALFRLTHPRPLLEAPRKRPLLFVEAGGISLEDVAISWFKNPALWQIPLLSTRSAVSELSSFELDQFAGIVLSLPSEITLTDELLAPYLKLQRPLIIVGPSNQELIANRPGLALIPRYSRPSWSYELGKRLLRVSGEAPHGEEILPLERGPERLSFAHHGLVLVNYSYARRWKSRDNAQHIFFAVPSKMAVFANGPTELYYQR